MEANDLDKPEGATPETEPKPETAQQDDKPFVPQDKPIPLTASKPAKPGQPPRPKYTNASSSSAARKLTYIVLFETLFVLILMGADVYLLLHTQNLKKTITERDGVITKQNEEIKNLGNDLSKSIAEGNQLTQKNSQLSFEKKALEKNLEVTSMERDVLKNEKANLNIQLAELKTELETTNQQLAETSAMLTKTEADLKAAVDEAAGLTKKLSDVSAERDKLLEQNKDIRLILKQFQEEKEMKQQEFETAYGQYQPGAAKVIAEIGKIMALLEAGANLKQFQQALNDFKVPYEEFMILQNEKSYNYLSFKLIKQAYDNYTESLERWKQLAKLNPNGDKNEWRNKVLKRQEPIKDGRPWVDRVQQLCRESLIYINTAGALVDVKESFSADKCPACGGKHSFTCIKCNGSGNCFACDGRGYKEVKDQTVACDACEGTGKCPVCQGRTAVPCYICILGNK
ncbi:MAG: hypothetical protein HY762_00695 [Planctomycetes bacterium]|nr:hypothetical protein [Planctomycetota bacterium]